MKRFPIPLLLTAFTFFFAACTAAPASENDAPMGPMGPMGMGGSSMMQRHRASIPDEYASLTNPVPADAESLTRGEAIYTVQCAVCHGDGGLGDGPGGEALDPPPTNIAHTSQMMSDAYLFWRISEGGVPFQTAMPAWKDAFDEQARWDMINYIRALGSGEVTPRRGMGGEAFDPAQQATQQAEMLAAAVEQGVITAEEARVFEQAHALADARIIEMRGSGMGGPMMDQMLNDVLDELVDSGQLTREQADIFLSVHERLGEAGLME